MKKFILIVIFLLIQFNNIFSQVLDISGQVVDKDGNAVENAVISVKGSDVQTTSNKEGKYTLTVNMGDVLLITHKGNITKEIEVGSSTIVAVGDNNIIDVQLADEEEYYDMSLEDLMQIEVQTASKTKQSFSESPSSMIVVTQQMIKDRGYHHLEEILHDLPGFDFNKNFGVNYSTIFMRGFRSANSDRFILMFDGILENDIWKQTTWISRQYPVSQIKQIEVLYGPASALYGTNAFSGIINVITNKGEDVGDINLVTTAGSWGRKNIEFATGKKVNDNISYNITAKYFAQDDLHQWDFFDAINEEDNNFSQDYLNKIGNHLLFSIDGKLAHEDFLQPNPSENYGIHANVKMGDLTFTALNWTKKELEAYFYNPFKRSGPWTQWYENNQGYSLTHNIAVSDKITLLSNLVYRNHKVIDSKEGGFKYYSAPLTDPLSGDYAHSQTIVPSDPTTYQLKPIGVTLDNGIDTFVTGIIYHYQLQTWDMAFEEQFNYKILDNLELIAGMRYTYTNTQEDYEIGVHINDIVSTPRHLKKSIAGYSQVIYKPFDLLSLTIGGRYEDQKDEHNIGYEIFTPRVSALIKVSDNLLFRLQYAEAFQDADDWHKFATDFDVRPKNSSHLEPEKLKAFELGTTIKLFDKVLLMATGYYTIVSNFIGEVENTPANPYYGFDYGLHYDNISGGEVTIYGYEVNFNAQLFEGFSLNGNFSGAFNYGPADKMEKGADGNYVVVTDINGNPIADDNVLIGDMAPFKANFGILYNYKNKISIYPKVNFVATKKTINWRADLESPAYREIESYAIIGLNINIINLLGYVKGLDINIKFDNLTNMEYYNPGSRSADGTVYNSRVLQPGFNFMAGLYYNF